MVHCGRWNSLPVIARPSPSVTLSPSLSVILRPSPSVILSPSTGSGQAPRKIWAQDRLREGSQTTAQDKLREEEESNIWNCDLGFEPRITRITRNNFPSWDLGFGHGLDSRGFRAPGGCRGQRPEEPRCLHPDEHRGKPRRLEAVS